MTDKLIPLTWTNTSIPKSEYTKEEGKRESGLYWVIFYDKWTIAEYFEHPVFGFWWNVIGDEMTWGDSDFSQIGPKVEFEYNE